MNENEYPGIPFVFIAWDPNSKECPSQFFVQHLKIFKQLDVEDMNEFHVHFYYSIRDLYYFFCQSVILKSLKMNFPGFQNQSFLVRKKAYFGRILIFFQGRNIPFVIHDLFGWSSGQGGGLAGLIQSLGLPTKNKNVISSTEKLNMDFYAQTNTKEFLIYAISDAIILKDIRNTKISYLNQILTDVLHFPAPFLLNERNIQYTTGSLVANIFENFLYHFIDQITEKQTIRYQDKEISFVQLFQILNRKTQFNNQSILQRNQKKTKKWDKYFSNFLNGGSIRSIAHQYLNTSGILNVFVNGGRCMNERPDEYLVQNIFDVDISGCYGSAFKSFDYPIGLPFVYAGTHNDPTITLKEFLKIYEHDLVPNMYTITISGILPFYQNLIYSKILTAEKMVRRIQSLINEMETSTDSVSLDHETDADFTLLSHEIVNGILTHDSLQLLRKVCTNHELKEIYNCKVETAMFYKKSDRCDTFQQFLQEVQPTILDYTFNVETQTPSDRRSRKWFPIPLQMIVEPLMKERKNIKAQMKIEADENRKRELDGKQNDIKLVINTIYGILSSPYFDIGNTVVANNITNRARTYIWTLSRCFHGFQSITDGCAYQPNNIFQIRHPKSAYNYLPGLSILSNFHELKKHRNIRTTSLEGKDWNTWFGTESGHQILRNEYPHLDRYVTKHYQEFWGHYDIQLPYELEHKVENTSTQLFYLRKAHYALQRIEKPNNIKYKIRGLNPVENSKPVYHSIIESFFFHQKIQLQSLEHFEVTLFGPTDFQISIKKRQQDFELPNLNPIELKIPGFSCLDSKTFHYTMTDRICVNQKMFKSVKNQDEDYAAILLDEGDLTTNFDRMFRMVQQKWNEIYQKELFNHLKNWKKEQN